MPVLFNATTRRISPAALLTLCIAIVAGCGGASGGGTSAAAAKRISMLCSLYAQASAELGHPPANEAELKGFMATRTMNASALGISTPDDLLVSPRDGKPLVVLYDKAKGKAASPLVHEQDGVDGKRLVGYSGGKVEEVDATRFAELVAPAK
jgi:hypothetical protein